MEPFCGFRKRDRDCPRERRHQPHREEWKDVLLMNHGRNSEDPSSPHQRHTHISAGRDDCVRSPTENQNQRLDEPSEDKKRINNIPPTPVPSKFSGQNRSEPNTGAFYILAFRSLVRPNPQEFIYLPSPWSRVLGP